MNYEKAFEKFPVLEGQNIRLRKVTAYDIPAIFELLKDEDVIREYSPIGAYSHITQAANNFLFNPDVNFAEKTQIVWVIEHKQTKKVIGIRELFFDEPDKPITVQGFIEKSFRKKGLSQEAYNLIIDFARIIQAPGLLANSSIENYPAIALMHSVGFKQNYVADTKDGVRAVFFHDLDYFDRPAQNNLALKRIEIFANMFLKGYNILIEEDGQLLREGSLNRSYRVQLTAINTFGPTIYHIFEREMEFISDGRIFMAPDDYEYIGSMDGQTRFVDALRYAWNCCIKKQI
jgi:RimJ/RimL family protein N-acetyltransferase